MKIYKILALGLLVVIAVGYFIFNDNYFNIDIHSHISPSNKASLDMLSLNTNSSVNDKPIQNDKLTKTTKHAKRHFWLTDVCTCHGLLPSHSA